MLGETERADAASTTARRRDHVPPMPPSPPAPMLCGVSDRSPARVGPAQPACRRACDPAPSPTRRRNPQAVQRCLGSARRRARRHRRLPGSGRAPDTTAPAAVAEGFEQRESQAPFISSKSARGFRSRCGFHVRATDEYTVFAAVLPTIRRPHLPSWFNVM